MRNDKDREKSHDYYDDDEADTQRSSFCASVTNGTRYYAAVMALGCFQMKQRAKIGMTEYRITQRQKRFGTDYIGQVVDDRAAPATLQTTLQTALKDVRRMKARIETLERETEDRVEATRKIKSGEIDAVKAKAPAPDDVTVPSGNVSNNKKSKAASSSVATSVNTLSDDGSSPKPQNCKRSGHSKNKPGRTTGTDGGDAKEPRKQSFNKQSKSPQRPSSNTKSESPDSLDDVFVIGDVEDEITAPDRNDVAVPEGALPISSKT